MKSTLQISAVLVTVAALLSGCVLQSRYDKFEEKVNLQLEILACESRVDAYENHVNSDEPDITRRDEPLPTRRDEPEPTRRDLQSCQAEFNRVVGAGNNYSKCQPKLKLCADKAGSSVPQCLQCFDTCMNSADGTWPEMTCSLP